MMYLARKIIVPCLLVLISFAGQSQSRVTDDLSISLQFQHGYILPEYSNLLYVVEKPVQSISINLQKRTTGKTDWEQLFNYPEYGFCFFYSTLGNNKVHGKELSLFPYFQLNIITSKKFKFYNQTGVGLAYVTKKFDAEKNYLNVAVGSNINLHFNLKFGADYSISKKTKLQAGIAFDHFSNGNTQEPNLGLNFVTGFAGLRYDVGRQSSTVKHDIEPHKRTSEFEIVTSVGGKHPKGPDTGLFFTSSLSLEYKMKFFRAIHFGIGIDGFYDTSTQSEMLASQNLMYKSIDRFRTGLHISQEFRYSRLSLILQQGLYVGLQDQVTNKKIYNKSIVKLQVSKHVFAQFAMKSHLHILDYPEFGLGINI